MTYKIIGDFKRKVPIDELGNKNSLEYCKEAVDLFGCIIYPNESKKMVFYSPETFYQRSEKVIDINIILILYLQLSVHWN